MIPHSLLVDLGHRSELRAAIIRQPRDFVTPVKGNSVNWVKPLDAALEINPATASLHLTRTFKEHVMNQENWTYSKAYFEMFPEVHNMLRFKND